MKRAKISALLLPGIGTIDDLKMAVDCGVGTIRVATHCTEADVASQHIGMARKLGVDTVVFLMTAHMKNSPKLVVYALVCFLAVPFISLAQSQSDADRLIEEALRPSPIEQNLRHSLMWVISIGTNEIQRTLIAQRGLGLPR